MDNNVITKNQNQDQLPKAYKFYRHALRRSFTNQAAVIRRIVPTHNIRRRSQHIFNTIGTPVMSEVHLRIILEPHLC